MKVNNDLIKQIKIKPLLDTLRLESISDDEYFSERYNGYISNSRLGLLKSKGVESFFEGLQANNEYSSSFFFGTLLHQKYLQPNSFEVVDGVFSPTAKARLMALELYNPDGRVPTDDEIKIASYKIGYYKDKLTESRITELRNKCNDFWSKRVAYESANPYMEGDPERIYVDERTFGLLKCCLDACNSNEEFENLIHPTGIVENPYTANEKTILLDVEVEVPEYQPKVFKLKSKLDNFTINKEENIITVNDLKTTSRLARDFDPSFFSYQRELGMYGYLLKLCSQKFFDLEKPNIKGNFLVVSTVPDYNTLVYPMTSKMFKEGFNEFKYLLQCAAYFNVVEGYEFQ